MKTYEIWAEGFNASGNIVKAQKQGVATVNNENSFHDACACFFITNGFYNSERNTYWGCRLFDNEEDARKSFG